MINEENFDKKFKVTINSGFYFNILDLIICKNICMCIYFSYCYKFNFSFFVHNFLSFPNTKYILFHHSYHLSHIEYCKKVLYVNPKNSRRIRKTRWSRDYKGLLFLLWDRITNPFRFSFDPIKGIRLIAIRKFYWEDFDEYCFIRRCDWVDVITLLCIFAIDDPRYQWNNQQFQTMYSEIQRTYNLKHVP